MYKLEEEVDYAGVKIKKIEIEGWECTIGDKMVVFPTLDEAKKEIMRIIKSNQ